MVIMPFMYGGLCNNILQIANCLEFLTKYNIDIDENNFKIIKKYERRYDSYYCPKQNKDLIFKELNNFFINDYNLKNFYKIQYNEKFKKDFKCINISNNYSLIPYLAISSKLQIYNFLKIKDKQLMLLKKYNFDNNCICMHIRRGDFLTCNKQDVLTDDDIICRINYYYNKRKIWIQTNDIDYVKNLLSKYKLNYFDDLNLNLDEEFLLASTCETIVDNPGSNWSRLLVIFSSFLHNKNDFKYCNIRA